jgi:hypothetical protein
MVYDIALNEDLDLIFQNGDFKKTESTKQHQTLILITAQGEWRASPWIGANLLKYINGYNQQFILQQIQKQMTLDGMNVKEITFDKDRKIIIIGSYES